MTELERKMFWFSWRFEIRRGYVYIRTPIFLMFLTLNAPDFHFIEGRQSGIQIAVRKMWKLQPGQNIPCLINWTFRSHPRMTKTK